MSDPNNFVQQSCNAILPSHIKDGYIKIETVYVHKDEIDDRREETKRRNIDTRVRARDTYPDRNQSVNERNDTGEKKK